MKWHLGTMGFGYKQWVGPFYPAGMGPAKFLGHYSHFFDAVEIDSTFYGTPAVSTVQRWAAVTPHNFTFAVKTPRSITHDHIFHNPIEEMIAFLDVVRHLKQKLGVVLLQFPPDFSHDQFHNLVEFIPHLPADLRYAVEFRHRSWEQPGTAAFLQAHNICWVTADYIYLSSTIHPTIDFLYLRFIGPHGQFGSKDRELVDKTAVLQGWQQKLQPHLDSMTAVYGFFNNDYSGFSPATCNKFKHILGLDTPEIRPLQQGRLF